MDCLDLNKVTCRICITGDESIDGLSNLFTKTLNETVVGATKLINDDVVLNMPLSDALVSFTYIELQQDHGLPETICQKCESQLVETLSFIHRTNNTQKILNSYAARINLTKVKTEDIDVNEESSYVIEELNDEGEVIQDEYENKSFLSSVKPNNSNEESNDCDKEDAVSFLKRANVLCDTTESLKPIAARSFECTDCKKSFFKSENLKSHFRTHMKRRKLLTATFITEYDSTFESSHHASNHPDESVTSSTVLGVNVDDFDTNYYLCDAANTNKQIEKPKRKRLPRIKRNWELNQRFTNGNDAKEFVKSERTWSIATTNQTVEGVKVLYRCTKAKQRGRQCECALYLLYLLESDGVLLFRTQNQHTCQANPRTYNPITDELKNKIVAMFKDGIRQRKQIQTKLTLENIEVPSKNQLNNLIHECRRNYRKLWIT